MELVVLRVLVNAFDPIGVLIPAFVAFAAFRKARFGWVWTGLAVASWRCLAYMALGGPPITTGGATFMFAVGLIGGLFWFAIGKAFGVLRNHLRPK